MKRDGSEHDLWESWGETTHAGDISDLEGVNGAYFAARMGSKSFVIPWFLEKMCRRPCLAAIWHGLCFCC